MVSAIRRHKIVEADVNRVVMHLKLHGKITKDELPEFLRERILGRVDANKDGIIEKSEAERLVE